MYSCTVQKAILYFVKKTYESFIKTFIKGLFFKVI